MRLIYIALLLAVSTQSFAGKRHQHNQYNNYQQSKSNKCKQWKDDDRRRSRVMNCLTEPGHIFAITLAGTVGAVVLCSYQSQKCHKANNFFNSTNTTIPYQMTTDYPCIIQ